MREPNFQELLKVLRCEMPSRPTLFEFFLNSRLYKKLSGPAWTADPARISQSRLVIAAFRAAGYDYASVPGSGFGFPSGERHRGNTISLNDGAVITDRKSFDAYKWQTPDPAEYGVLDQLAEDVPRGMKLIVFGPGGVLENAISLVGYDTLCFLIADDPKLVEDTFAAIGSRLVRHYELAAPHQTVGACISNDDWGFKTQTMLSIRDMRRFVFPWHKRIVEAIHKAGKPAILHSCGNPEGIMEDIIGDMKYDGKHSFEDVICPIEETYKQWGGRVALLGGIDVNFICQSSCEAIRKRSKAMLAAANKGGYALGTGNSVPEYIDDDKYFAMTSAALEP